MNSIQFPDLKKIKGIIFDFDGVIVDTEWAIYQSWVRLYQREKQELSISSYAPCLGAGYSYWNPATYLEQLTGKEYQWDIETAQRQAEIEADLRQMGLMTGVMELLDWCDAQGIMMTVASSSSRRWVGGWLDRLGIMERFAKVICRTDGYPVKPNPSLFLAARDAMGLPSSHCLVIEDSENGTIAAQNAGIACVAIPNRMTKSSDLSRASSIHQNLASLLKALQKAHEGRH